MTFLRKRSRSQCSASTCDEEFSITRKQSKDIRRYSGMSSNTQVTARDYELHDSCVLRNFPKHKSAHLRFLTWVQYTRQFPEYPITDEERRTCPLLWCRETFESQDAMLKHVWNCEHLSKGLYWCFQCQKPERVGKFQCRRCQGGSSKTDRIATVARKMFSALGTKKGLEKSIEDRGLALSKISETSEVRESWNSGCLSRESMIEERQSYLDPPFMPELPDNYILEMENTSVIPEMSGGLNEFSQELPAPRLSRSNRRCQSTDSQTRIPSTESPSDQLSKTWNINSNHDSPRPTRSILPRLNTNTMFDLQSPPSNLIPTNIDFHISDNPMSATLVSPLSPTGGFDFGTFDALDISPTDTVASGQSLFTDSGYSSATVESSWNGSDVDLYFTQERQSLKEPPKKPLDPPRTEKFLGWPSIFSDPSIFPQPSEVTQVNMNTIASIPDMAATHSAGRCDISEIPRELSPHWSDAQSLVKSFAEVLKEHLRHSRAALQQMAANNMTRELLSLSSSSIISIGFEVLAGLLEGRRPTAVVPLFTFTHIAYALAIAVDHDSSKVQTSEWFQDSLALLENLVSERQRQTYTQIVRVIWQPRVSFTPANSLTFRATFEFGRSTENRLTKACQHFLDILESFSYHDKSSSSQFNFVQVAFANRVKAHKVIDELIKKSSIEAFIEDVVQVEKRLNNGLIVELRQLELELICAGKLASQADIALSRFQDHVTELCDSLRAEDKLCKSRTAHHLDDIALIQQLLPEEDESNIEIYDNEAELEFQLPDSGYSTWDLTTGDELQEIIDSIFTPQTADSGSQRHSTESSFASIATMPVLPAPKASTPRTPRSLGLPHPPVSRSAPNNSTPFLPPKLHRHQSAQPFQSPPISRSSPAPAPAPPVASQNKYRCHCGFEPKGSEEWKASNLARHKRTQHASAMKVYRCQYPGCSAKYKRSDNLRAHLRFKSHGDATMMLGDLGDGGGEEDVDVDVNSTLEKRPSKRRRREDGGNKEMGLS